MPGGYYSSPRFRIYNGNNYQVCSNPIALELTLQRRLMKTPSLRNENSRKKNFHQVSLDVHPLEHQRRLTLFGVLMQPAVSNGKYQHRLEGLV